MIRWKSNAPKKNAERVNLSSNSLLFSGGGIGYKYTYSQSRRAPLLLWNGVMPDPGLSRRRLYLAVGLKEFKGAAFVAWDGSTGTEFVAETGCSEEAFVAAASGDADWAKSSGILVCNC